LPVPNYTFDSFFLERILAGIPEGIDCLVKNLTDANRIHDDVSIRNAANTLAELKRREIFHAVTVPVSDFIMTNYKEKRIMHTTNHPTSFLYFEPFTRHLEKYCKYTFAFAFVFAFVFAHVHSCINKDAHSNRQTQT
jgi:hypothetical protein